MESIDAIGILLTISRLIADFNNILGIYITGPIGHDEKKSPNDPMELQ
jgi:hypothetical protein